MQIHQGMETLRQAAPNLVNTFGVSGATSTTTPSTTTTSTTSTTQANTTTTQSSTTTTNSSTDPFSEVRNHIFLCFVLIFV